MADADQPFSCLRPLGAAISDSSTLRGSAGLALRRSLADFATFATRMEEEVVDSTKEQLEQTLKSIENFHIALGEVRSSLEWSLSACAATDAENMVATHSVSSSVSSSAPSPLLTPSPTNLYTVSNISNALDSLRVDENGNEEDESSEKSATVKNEIECPECEHLLPDAPSWVAHLRSRHSTSPILAGFLLRCDCGHESYSDGHSTECKISNYTVIRTKDTPQCVACEKYPATTFYYVLHLMRHHKATLEMYGIYLQCSCGARVTDLSVFTHRSECEGRCFRIHKVDKK